MKLGLPTVGILTILSGLVGLTDMEGSYLHVCIHWGQLRNAYADKFDALPSGVWNKIDAQS